MKRHKKDDTTRGAIGVWHISVTDYGAFDFVGSEDDAEEMRRHKASWEGGVGTKKRIADATEEQIARYRREKARECDGYCPDHEER